MNSRRPLGRFLGRLLAVCALATATTIAFTGCASTLTDAATVSFPGQPFPTQHIDRTQFEEELRVLDGSTQFQELLRGNPNFSDTSGNPEAIGTDIAATYVSQRIAQAPDGALFEYFDLQISNEHRQQAAQAEQQRFSAAVFDSFPKWFRDRLIEDAARGFAVDEYFANPTPEKVRTFFELFRDEICPNGRLVSHILVRTEEAARDALDQLEQGRSFESVANEVSLDEGSKVNGGQLGCLVEGAFVKEFEDAAKAAPFGEVVGPVQTQFGFHLIQVTELQFEQIQGQLAQEMQQRGASLILSERMEVWINPRFGSIEFLESDQGGPRRFRVVPPEDPNVRTQREAPAVTTSTQPLSVGG